MNQVLLTFQSLLKWPEYGFVGLIVLVWRSVEVAYWNSPLEDDFSDLDPRHSARLAQLLWLTSMHQKFPLTKSETPPVLPCLSFWNSLFPFITILQSCELSHHFSIIPMNNSALDETLSPWCHLGHQFQPRMLSALFMWTEPARTFCFSLLPAAKFYWTFQTLRRYFKYIYEVGWERNKWQNISNEFWNHSLNSAS